MAAPHSRQSHQNFITRFSDFNWNKIETNLYELQTYIRGHISVDDIVLMVETSCNKIESIELISFESS